MIQHLNGNHRCRHSHVKCMYILYNHDKGNAIKHCAKYPPPPPVILPYRMYRRLSKLQVIWITEPTYAQIVYIVSASSCGTSKWSTFYSIQIHFWITLHCRNSTPESDEQVVASIPCILSPLFTIRLWYCATLNKITIHIILSSLAPRRFDSRFEIVTSEQAWAGIKFPCTDLAFCEGCKLSLMISEYWFR